MRADALTLRYQAGAGGLGRLEVDVRSAGFAGHAGAWFDAIHLAEFAVSLMAFPISSNGLRLAGGFWSKVNNAELEEEHVGLRFRDVGYRGQVGVGVHLAGETDNGTRGQVAPEVRVELWTTYQRLREFSGSLTDLTFGRSAVVTLTQLVV
jgi:hypothetical protein